MTDVTGSSPASPRGGGSGMPWAALSSVREPGGICATGRTARGSRWRWLAVRGVGADHPRRSSHDRGPVPRCGRRRTARCRGRHRVDGGSKMEADASTALPVSRVPENRRQASLICISRASCRSERMPNRWPMNRIANSRTGSAAGVCCPRGTVAPSLYGRCQAGTPIRRSRSSRGTNASSLTISSACRVGPDGFGLAPLKHQAPKCRGGLVRSMRRPRGRLPVRSAGDQ